ncbi:MAG: hypothetical protein IJU72_08755 [Bacteroidales bacterium]|nr:hypothetical protein [Bacteroidales bacterium]
MLEPTTAANSFNQELTDHEFNQLSAFIYNESGIKLPPVKRIMLQCRLQKRLRELQMSSFREYCDYLFSHSGGDAEIVSMLDVVSTNKTDFFREPTHFDFISNTMLPEFMEGSRGGSFSAWSAGCSSGEEPYTLAFVLNEFMLTHPTFSYTILATDLSTKILQQAVTAIYPEERVTVVPMHLRQKYLLRSKDRQNPTVRIAPLIRQHVSFARLNFMDSTYSSVPADLHLVMCRNVLIYFDRATQEKVINKLCTRIRPNGYLMLGHSESILNMNLPLQQIKPTIYRKV